jgi:membrane protein DedA with SNARE-associated domain
MSYSPGRTSEAALASQLAAVARWARHAKEFPVVLALVSALLHVALSTADNLTNRGMMAEIVAALFDPTWNVENRRTIWTIIVTVLLLSGVGFPLPEDIPLTLAGFTTFKQANDQVVMWHFATAFAAVTTPILIGDVLAYGLGRRFGFGIRDSFSPLKRVLSDKRMARVQRWFDNYGSFTIFLGRQVAGVRFVTFFTAGTMRVPLVKFVFYDFLGCLVSVPVWLSLGVLASRYGEEWLRTAMRKVGSGFFVGVVVTILVFVLVTRLRNLRAKPPVVAIEPSNEAK